MNKIVDSKHFKHFLVGFFLIAVYFSFKNYNTISIYITNFGNIISPFVLGFVITYLLKMPIEAISTFFSKSKIKFVNKYCNALSIVLVYVILILLIVFSFALVLPLVFNQTLSLVKALPEYFYGLSLTFTDLINKYLVPLGVNPQTITSHFSFENIVEVVSTFLLNSVNNLMALPTLVLNFALSLIASVYFLIEGPKISKFIKRFSYATINEKAVDTLSRYFKNIDYSMKKFLFCLVIDAIFLGVASTILLTILGIDYTLLLGLLLGLFNLIPYFGAIIASVFVIIFIIITKGFAYGVFCGILLLILQQIDGNVIQPKLLGDSLKISPLLVIFSITVGGAYFGPVGMVVAVPIANVLKNILMEIIEYKEKSK